MPVYSYVAVDQSGRRVTGQMSATSESQLEEKLGRNNAWLIDAEQQRAPSTSDPATTARGSWFSSVVRRRDLIEFCTLMTFQTRVGIALVQALDVAAQDCENPKFRQVLAGVRRHLEGGALFYEALEKYPNAFTPHFVSVIRAGETSSRLPEAFEDLRNYLEWVERVLAEVRQASLYPAIVLTVVSGFVIGLFIFVIPKFAALLASVNAKLPLVTQLIFGLSDFMKNTWWIWLLALPGLVISGLIAKRCSKAVAVQWDRAKLNLPLFGELNWMLAISRFTHNLAILYRSGIPVIQSLNLCQGLIGNVVVEEAVKSTEESIKAGSTVTEAMRRHPIFPPLLIRMVLMGETTGSLDSALENVADYYGEIVPRRIKKILTTLEPALTLFMIGLVGMVALAIYLPILTLMDTIK